MQTKLFRLFRSRATPKVTTNTSIPRLLSTTDSSIWTPLQSGGEGALEP